MRRQIEGPVRGPVMMIAAANGHGRAARNVSFDKPAELFDVEGAGQASKKLSICCENADLGRRASEKPSDAWVDPRITAQSAGLQRAAQ
jgi:hypothetical protein